MPNHKLTLDVVKARLEPRGIRLISEYRGVNLWSTFTCDKGHSWEGRVSNVLGKTGCPKCAYEQKSSSMKLSLVDVQDRIAGSGIKIIGEYLGVTLPATFRCPSGHIWQGWPGNVMQGKGCPKCVPAFLSELNRMPQSVIDTRLAERGLVMLDNYVNGYTKARFQCNSGHIWATQPAHVISDGTGCPYCTERGFNRSADSVFYVLKVCGVSGDFTGFGVSNSPKSRLKQHRNNLAKRGFSIDEDVYISMVGEYALAVERSVKSTFACVPQEVEGFITEATHFSKFHEVVSFARSFVELNTV